MKRYRHFLIASMLLMHIGCAESVKPTSPETSSIPQQPDYKKVKPTSPETPFIPQQPDYKKWDQVQKGMTEQEVISLLGEPRLKEDRNPRVPRLLYNWTYGQLTPISAAFSNVLGEPGAIAFRIRFESGKVWGKEDPFNGRFSEDGKPTVPQLFSPPEGAMFHQYPRYFDLRWYPSSGVYPMRYEVEVSHDRIFTDLPYVGLQGGGMGKSKWKVRAINSLGTSEWSEYGTYEFSR